MNYFKKVDWQSSNEDYWKTASEDIQYKIWNEKNIMYIAFQCSMTKKDFNIAFDLFTKDKYGMKVHRGFYNAFNKAKNVIIADIISCVMLYNIDKAVIVGYSEGGVYASLLHQELKYANVLNISVETYTYGCCNYLLFPNKNILKRFEGVTNIVSKNDIVTMFPIAYRRGGKDITLINDTIIPSTFQHLQEYYKRSLI